MDCEGPAQEIKDQSHQKGAARTEEKGGERNRSEGIGLS